MDLLVLGLNLLQTRESVAESGEVRFLGLWEAGVRERKEEMGGR